MVHESSPYSAIFDLGKLQTGIYAIKLLGEDSAVQIYCRFCNNYADSHCINRAKVSFNDLFQAIPIADTYLTHR
jgi:hypothetical protein